VISFPLCSPVKVNVTKLSSSQSISISVIISQVKISAFSLSEGCAPWNPFLSINSHDATSPSLLFHKTKGASHHNCFVYELNSSGTYLKLGITLYFSI